MRCPSLVCGGAVAIALAIFNPTALLALGGTGAPPIDESAISITLHVSPTAPAGGNGTLASPFNTLQAALNRAVNTHNAAGQGVHIILAPGTYREGTPGATNAITFPTPSTAAPIIVEGAGWNTAAPANTGDVIISGSENWSGGWTSLGDGTWTRPWPYTWGVGPNNTGGGNPPEAMLRYELVHVNGATYYQMLGPTDPNLAHITATEGAFWVNESSGIITIRPPSGFGDLNTALVEVTTKRRLLHHWRSQAILTPTNIVLRNLVFQHAASGLNSGAVYLQNVIGLHVEDCVFRDNKQMGLSIAGINTVFTVRRTDIIRNGEMGSGFQGVNILAEDVRWNDNSRFADIIQYYGWGYGGIKIGASSNLTFRRIEASRNYGMGLWFDTGNVNCLVEDAVIVDNTSQGVWSENNNRNNIPTLGTTPTVVLRRVYSASNYKRSPQATATGGGFYITESENTHIEHSVLFDNAVQFRISDGPGRGPIANTTVRSSILASRQGEVQRLYATGYGTTGWQQFFDTLSSATGNNDYYYSGSTDGVTALSPQPQPDTTVAFYTRDQQLSQTLAQWKTLHAPRAADQDSRWLTTYTGQLLVHATPAANYRQENGGTVTGFWIRRVARDLTAPLTVHLTATGTATPGVHYQAFPASIVIPAGAREVALPFTPLASGQSYGELTVGLTLTAHATYIAPDPTASFLLEDTASAGQPRVSVTATTPLASEDGPTPGEFTLSRTGSTDTPLTITYSLGGTAAPSRYQPLSGQAIFPVGAATTTVILTPIDDATPQLSQTVTISVVAGSGYVPSIQDPVTATVTLRDNDITSRLYVTLPPGTSTINVPVTLHNPANVAQTFTVTLPDTSGADYAWADSTQSDGPAYEWIDIHAIPGRTEITELREVDDATTQFANGQSGTTGGIPLGFSFPFFSGTYNEIWLNSNGVIDLGARGQSSGRWKNSPLPTGTYLSTNNASAHILFFWDDLRLSETSPAARAYYARPDADTFLITLENFRHFSNPSARLNAQVILRSDGEIRINYQSVTIPYNLGSTIGLQGPATTGQPTVQVSYNNDYVKSGMSLRFRRPVRWLSAASTSFQVVVPAGDTATFDLTFAAEGLSEGLQTSTLLLSSDHLEQPAINLPVSLTISTVGPPSTPLNLAASTISNSSLNLTWLDLATNETGYRIERATTSLGPWSTVTTLPANTTAASDTGLAASSTYYYRVIAFNDHSDSVPSAIASATTLALTDVPPTFTDSTSLDLIANQPFSRLVRIDQEIRAFFDTAPIDTYPGTSGDGWLDPWTIRATTIETTATASLVSTDPLQNSGPHVRLTATATGAGKRAFLTRSYSDDPARRIDRAAPHRIVLELRPDDISGFADTNDRLYLWDRPTASNADHNNTDMTWAFITAGVQKEWRYYAGTVLSSTGVRLVEGHVYRFNIEVDPAQRRWRFTLRDLAWQNGDPGNATHTADWIAFRNAATGAPSVGSHLHAGAFLQSIQTAALSLDSVRITAADLTFASSALPTGFEFDPEIGRLSGLLASGYGTTTLAVANTLGTTQRDYTFALSTPYQLWSDSIAWPSPESNAPLADPDGDSLPNLLEYALNLDPLSAGSANLQPTVHISDLNSHLSLTFLRARPDLLYEVLASSTLAPGSWEIIATNPGTVSLTEPVTVLDPVPLSESPRRFLRLRVTQ